MIEYIASSDAVGRRPRISRIRSYSSSLRPSSAYGWLAVSGVDARPRLTVVGRGGRSLAVTPSPVACQRRR